MAAPLPPPLFAAEHICAGALLLGFSAAAWLGFRGRDHGKADANWHGLTLIIGLALSLLVAGVFQSPARILPPLAGLWAGLVTAWFWLPRAGSGSSAEAGALACGVMTVAGVGLAWQGVPAANAAIGWVGGAAAVGLLNHWKPAGSSLDGVWALVACAGGLAAWCDKLMPHPPIAWALSAGLLLLPLALWLLPARENWGHRLGLTSAWILGAGWWLLGVFHLPTTWLGAIALAGVVTLVSAHFQRPDRAIALACLVAGGALLVVENRVAGIAGVALGGLSLGVMLRAVEGAPWTRMLLVWLLAVFASRTWLQLFFERVEFTHYGVDITHPYATVGLLLGALAPAALMGRPTASHWMARLGLTLGALALPAALGYLLHIEALAAAWMGLIVSGFVLMAARAELTEENLTHPGPPPIAPGLLLTHGAVALLAAPWLVAALDATRLERVVVLLILAGVGALWLLLTVRANTARPGPDDARSVS